MRVFRAAWLTTLAAELSSDDIGAYLDWLRRNMGAMTEVDREKAKRIQRALVGEQHKRRSASRASRASTRRQAEGGDHAR